MSISELCVRRPVFATMLVMMLVVLGIFSFFDLGVDLFPKADPATVNVAISLPGASPDELTTSVVEPLEDALSSISGVDQMSSSMREGSASVTLRFVLGKDLNDAANSVREKVSGAMRYLPPQVLPPVIQKADPDSDPVMSIVLSSDNMSLRTLTEIASKQVKRRIESVDGVGQVVVQGGQAREVHVNVDVEKLNAYGLTIDQVRAAIQRENVEIPGGTIEQGKAQLALRTLGRITASDQFKDIIIATINGTPVRISDVGYVDDTTQTPNSYEWMDNGKPAVQLDIQRASGENTIKVTAAVRAKLDTIQKTLPAGLNMAVVMDNSRFIYASVASLEEHLLWGSLLAALVVMFFIRNIRAVLISALAIPASIIATFTLMRAMDFTLNNMTLLGVTLAVGIVIDDAIVVLENIFRYLEEKHCSPMEAAIQGTREVTLAVLATTLSLVAIFLPVAFMTGYARQFIYPFGWTMAFAILVSMFVSFTLTPMLSSRFLTVSHGGAGAGTKQQGFFRRVDRWYTSSLQWSLAHPRVIVGIALAVVAMMVPLNRIVGRTFIPSEDNGTFTVHVDAPEGTSLEGTSDMVKQFEKEIAGFDGIDHIEMLAGAGKISHGHLFVYLKPLDERTVTENEVIARVRGVMKSHPGANPSVTMLNPLGGSESGGFGFQATMQGPDMDTVSNYSLKLLSEGQHVPSIVDMKTSVSNSNPEIHVSVDRGRAADLGVSMSTVGDTLRLMVSGEDQISTYREGAEQYPVKIRVLESQRRDIDAIGKLTVGSSTAGTVRIDNIARLDRGFGPTQISRTNREFSISITGDVAPGHALDEASNDLRGLIRGLKLPPGYSGVLRGQTQILDETTANLMMAIGLGSIFVYMVLAAQFESFVQPIVIMLVLPLSIPFALFTLWATGRTLNLWSALGTLLLFGIVKKNAILQVDYANILRARGVPLHQAVVEACRTRLRPILMTTSAIIAGLIPTALGLGIGGAQRSAIAVTIIGGQTLCLFLTLLLVPVAYAKVAAFEEAAAGQRLSAAAKRFAAATFGWLRPAAISK